MLDTRQLILKHAQRHFAQYGYARASLQIIADELQLSKALLYYYFDSKAALFIAVVEKEAHHFFNEAEKILQTDLSAEEMLHEYMKKRNRLFADLVNLYRVYSERDIQRDHVPARLRDHLKRKERTVLSSILKKGMEGGNFQPYPVRQTADLLLDAAHGIRVSTARELKVNARPHYLMKKVEPRIKFLTSMMVEYLSANNN